MNILALRQPRLRLQPALAPARALAQVPVAQAAQRFPANLQYLVPVLAHAPHLVPRLKVQAAQRFPVSQPKVQHVQQSPVSQPKVQHVQQFQQFPVHLPKPQLAQQFPVHAQHVQQFQAILLKPQLAQRFQRLRQFHQPVAVHLLKLQLAQRFRAIPQHLVPLPTLPQHLVYRLKPVPVVHLQAYRLKVQAAQRFPRPRQFRRFLLKAQHPLVVPQNLHNLHNLRLARQFRRYQRFQHNHLPAQPKVQLLPKALNLQVAQRFPADLPKVPHLPRSPQHLRPHN